MASGQAQSCHPSTIPSPAPPSTCGAVSRGSGFSMSGYRQELQQVARTTNDSELTSHRQGANSVRTIMIQEAYLHTAGNDSNTDTSFV